MSMWRAVVAALVLTALVGCGHGSLPDSGTIMAHDTNTELIIADWENELGRLVKEGCAFYGTKIICNW